MMRNQRMRPKVTGALFLALLILLSVTAGADTIRESFDVAEGGLLTIETDLGSIEIQATSGNTVDVEVTRSGADADELDVDFSHNGNDVTIEGKLEGIRRFVNWGSRSRRVRFVVSVPKRYNLDLSTRGGSISVDDLEGEVRSKTSGGSLRFGQIHGPVTGQTSGGSISLSGSVGDANVQTSGGSIKIGDVDGEVKAHTSGGSIIIGHARGRVEAKTSGGSIRVEEVMGDIQASTSGGSVAAYISEQPTGDCRLTTSGGGVSVYLTEGIGVNVDARSSGVGVKSDFSVDGGSKSRTSLRGRINGGGPELYLRSSGGGVRIARK